MNSLLLKSLKLSDFERTPEAFPLLVAYCQALEEREERWSQLWAKTTDYLLGEEPEQAVDWAAEKVGAAHSKVSTARGELAKALLPPEIKGGRADGRL